MSENTEAAVQPTTTEPVFSLDQPADEVLKQPLNAQRRRAGQRVSVDSLFQQLRTLWKGTLYTTIYGLYVLFVGWLFVFVDWRAALTAMFAIIVTHPLRYIVNSVDKVGWQLDGPVDGNADAARKYQQRLYYGLYGAIMLCNVFLVGLTWYVSDTYFALGSVVLLGVVEVLFWQIQSLNKTIEYAWANYGSE
jgi:hypothetical protein